MNETIKTLRGRRSIRNYKQEQIKDGDLQAILESGNFAPSGMNCQPWHFTVVQNKDIMNKLNSLIKEGMLKSDSVNKEMKEIAKSEYFSAFYNAPALIIISGDKSAVTPQFDCTLAMGNMFNAAASLGIGSCWIHAVSMALNSEYGKDLAEELSIPEGNTVYCSGVFGFNASESPLPAPRKEGTVTFIK